MIGINKKYIAQGGWCDGILLLRYFHIFLIIFEEHQLDISIRCSFYFQIFFHFVSAFQVDLVGATTVGGVGVGQ